MEAISLLWDSRVTQIFSPPGSIFTACTTGQYSCRVGDANTPAAPDLEGARKLAYESSPNASVQLWKTPVLLIQGDDDRNVPSSQTVDLAQRLRDNHVPVEILVFPDEIHDFLMFKSWLKAYGATADFFARYLKKP